MSRAAKERDYRPRGLTDEQVRAIRSKVADGLGQSKTAILFGVSHGVVNQIIRGVTYKDVTQFSVTSCSKYPDSSSPLTLTP